ncbi:Bacteriophage replication gene A protein (GPA) [Variovorax sp. SRS16]|nr:Bacteriophage replication gene A protein (GPA) [Variovorax sp. SRS16]
MMRAGHVSRYAAKNPGAFDLYERIKLNSVVDRFPLSWRERMVRALGKLKRETFDVWRERVSQLVDAERGGLRPDAGDADICTAADLAARDMGARLKDLEAVWIGRQRAEAHGPDYIEAMQALMCKALLDERGMLDLWPVGASVTRSGAIKRLCDARWWRRTLRKLHARTVEACAIGIGLVSRAAGLYASNEAVKRRAGQNARNAAALESVTAVNDLMQAQTLAELAAKGTANKAIRRMELLTRIAGFELIAKDLGHIGFMVTMTCPSRFHKMTTRADGRVVPNPRYDGSTPHDAQKYLSGQWAKCRAAAARDGLGWYGFRIAEPQHDGTPHWHSLLFVSEGGALSNVGPVSCAWELRKLVRRYFLDADSPDEPGAQKHRVDFERIDWAKGSAVGYVIKYVSKNIDGHGVGLDLFGNDAITSSQRVEAWASTWRIRQFQQIGGAPVGVWRELRRINVDNIGAHVPEALRVAVSAVNAKGEPGVQSIAWKRYTAAQGGIGTKRKDMALKLMTEDRGDFAQSGRYGEPLAPKLLGVDAAGVQLFRNHIHVMNPAAPDFKRPSFASVESERCAWVVTHGSRDEAERAARVVFERSGEAASTRIHVNNCTGRDLSRVSEWAPVRTYAPRLRRFVARPKPPEPVAPLEPLYGLDEYPPY